MQGSGFRSGVLERSPSELLEGLRVTGLGLAFGFGALGLALGLGLRVWGFGSLGLKV